MPFLLIVVLIAYGLLNLAYASKTVGAMAVQKKPATSGRFFLFGIPTSNGGVKDTGDPFVQ